METTAAVQGWQYGYLELRWLGGLLPDRAESLRRFTAELNRWGADGWELVNVTAGEGGLVLAFLKRPIPAPADPGSGLPGPGPGPGDG